MLELGRRQIARLPCIRGCPWGENVLLEETFGDKFFHVLLEGSAMDGLLPLTVIKKTIFFHFGENRVVSDQLWALNPWLVLDGVEDFVNEEPQRSEVLFHLEGLEWIR